MAKLAKPKNATCQPEAATIYPMRTAYTPPPIFPNMLITADREPA
jgi:hypothetical protein